MTKTDALRIDIDLYTLDRSRFGQEFGVRKRRPNHQERVASRNRLLRWFGAQQADPTSGVGAVIRHSSFTQKSFDDRCTESLRELFQFPGGVQSTLTCEDCNLLSAIENIRRMFQLDLRWKLLKVSGDRGSVMNRVSFRSPLLDL
jgi:hypothetical protein